VQHVNRPPGVLGQVLRYTLKLPWTLKELAGSATDQRRPAGTDSTGALIFPSEEEENAIRALGNMVSASVASGSIGEEGSGLMTVSVTAGDAVLSARLNRRFIDHLRSRVREIRTKSTQQNLDFVQQRFAQVQTELEAAEDRLSQFLERNRSVLSGGRAPQLEFQRDRLQRQVTFKEQLYSQLQTRVTETQLQLQKQQPVVTIAETPAPPMEPSAPKRTLIVLLSLILGGFVGTGIAIILQSTQNQDGEMQAKYDEVKRSFTVRGLWRGVRDRATATKDKVD
jgi:capsule polysaccharide export protein KpsE/RkpR